MDQKLLELGVGLIAAILVIREVLGFLEKRRINGDGGSEKVMKEYMEGTYERVNRIEHQVDDLFNWHNQRDQDGIPLWYVKRSFEESIKEMAEAMREQIKVQTQIARRMEDIYREKIEK